METTVLSAIITLVVPRALPAMITGGCSRACGVLLSLAALTVAPYAPWSSDRFMIERNGLRIRRHNRFRA